MRISFGIGLGITMQQTGGWWGAYAKDGIAPAFIASFYQDRYFADSADKEYSDVFTFTRAGAKPAWLANGDMGWAGMNLLTYSEDFSHADWTKTNATVSGDEITVTSAASTNHIWQPYVTSSGATYTLNAEFKAGTASDVGLKFTDQGVGSYVVDVDLVGVTAVDGSGGRTPTNISIESKGNGWYAVAFDLLIPTGGSDTVYLTEGASPFALNDTYQARKIHLYRSDYGGMQPNLELPATPTYYPTTSAAYHAQAVAYDPVTLTKTGLVMEGNDLTRLNTYPVCNDGTGWADDGGATTTNLSLDVFGAFDGASIASGGSASDKLFESSTVSLTDALVYPFTFFYRAGTSLKADLMLHDTTNASYSTYAGVIGSLVSGLSAAGSLSEVSEVLLSDGETYELSGYITKTTTGTTRFEISPNSTTSGETVIAIGAFIGDAGEKLPACPIIGGDGSSATVVKDVLSLDGVASGDELLDEGHFTGTGDTTGWTLEGTATNNNGVDQFDVTSGGATSTLATHDTIVAEVGKTYRITYNRKTAATSFIQFGGELTAIAADIGVTTSDVTATTTGSLGLFSGGPSNRAVFDDISVQELVPFVGFDASQGTFVFKFWGVHRSADDVFFLSDGSLTRFIYQSSTEPTNLRSYDGTSVLVDAGVFTDNTPIAAVMSYLESGAFNLLADGGVEQTASLTGDLYVDSLDIGHSVGGKGIHAVLQEIIYFPAQLSLATRQTFEAIT